MKLAMTQPLATAALAVSCVLLSQHALGQTSKDLIGWWTVVSVTNVRDGKTTDVFGPSPKGYAVLDATGHFAFAYMRTDLPKFGSANRTAGTESENKAAVQGSLSYFGDYTYDEANKTLVLHVEGSTFPNWVGETQKRVVTLAADEMRLVNETTSLGTGTNVTVFRRVK